MQHTFSIVHKKCIRSALKMLLLYVLILLNYLSDYLIPANINMFHTISIAMNMLRLYMYVQILLNLIYLTDNLIPVDNMFHSLKGHVHDWVTVCLQNIILRKFILISLNRQNHFEMDWTINMAEITFKVLISKQGMRFNT